MKTQANLYYNNSSTQNVIDYGASGDKKYVNIVFLQGQCPSNEQTKKNGIVSRKEKSLQNARRDNNMKGET